MRLGEVTDESREAGVGLRLGPRTGAMTDARDQAIIEALSRLILAQDSLKRLSALGEPRLMADVWQAVAQIAEASGWLQTARRTA